MTVGDRLKAWRLKLSLSQGEVAREAGMSTSQMSQIENGYMLNVQPKTERRLAAALGISLDEFRGLPPTDRPRLLDALKRDDIDFEGKPLTELEKAAMLATLKAIRESGKQG